MEAVTQDRKPNNMDMTHLPDRAIPESVERPAGDSGYSLASPQVEVSGKKLVVTRRAIKDVAHLYAIVAALDQEQKDADSKNAQIVLTYNGEAPNSPRKQADAGLSWMANISTKPLATLMDKVPPRYVDALDRQRSLTSAELPPWVQNAPKKSAIFQREFTKLVRGHVDWEDLKYDASWEMANFGFCFVGYTSQAGWFPKFYRSDRVRVPKHTKSSMGGVGLLVLKEVMEVSELYTMVGEDEDVAKEAGWNLDAVAVALNTALPELSNESKDQNKRSWAEMGRESGYCSLGMGGAKVTIGHVFVREGTGKVSHFIVDLSKAGREGLLYEAFDRFEQMPDTGAFLTFQHGTGQVLGSKGLGRELYNCAMVLDRARCELMNRIHISGKIFLSGDEANLGKIRTQTYGQFVVVPNTFKLEQVKLEGGTGEYEKMEALMQRLIDEMSGNISPSVLAALLPNERVSNEQMEAMKAMQGEQRTDKITRYLNQWKRIMQLIQTRIKDSDDNAVEAMRSACLEHMSLEEFNSLCDAPVARVIGEMTGEERVRTLAVTEGLLGNPMINQTKLLETRITAGVSAELAATLVIPENDQVQVIEQTRMQKSELEDMKSNGDPVEVSPRDNHEIHLNTMAEQWAKWTDAEQGLDAEVIMGLIPAFTAHMAQHADILASLGGKAVEELVGQARQLIQQILTEAQGIQEAQAQQAEEAALAEAGIGGEQMPMGATGVVPMEPGMEAGMAPEGAL